MKKIYACFVLGLFLTLSVAVSSVFAATTVFFDDFESGNLNKWTESNEFDWNVEGEAEKNVPGHPSNNLVAHADNCDSFCVLTQKDAVDLSSYDTATLKFWRYVDKNLDNGEYLKVEVYDGSSWNQIFYWTHGSGDDDTWHYETYTLGSEYLISDFKVRYTSKENRKREETEIDDVLIEGEVTDSMPDATASASPTSGSEPLFVQFNGTVVGGDAPLTFLWDFKDGTNSTLQNPTHTFLVDGVYNVSFTVTDNDGDSDTDYVLITVNNNAPIADASASPISGYDSLNVSFTGGVTGGNAPFTFFWNFTDGGTSTLQNPVHTFLGGVYEVLFRVTDDDGDSDTDTVTITVGFCGDDTKNGPEICDGTDLDGETCSTQGFDGGTLACNSNCGGFDTSGCWDNTCTDSDGFDIFTAGNTTGLSYGFPYTHFDFCLDSTTVVEYTCSGKVSVSSNHTCITNTTSSCVSGACV